jgi:hypothetical protein
MMWVVRPLLAFLSAALLSTSSLAATISATQGQVLVNQGSGYQQVVGSVDVGSGATIVVNPGGSAQIVYPDGCAVAVQPGSVYTISPQSPCLAQGGQTTTGVNGTTLALGAVVVGGGVAALLLLNSSDKSASP